MDEMSVGRDESEELALVSDAIRPWDRVVEGGSGVYGHVTEFLVDRCSLVVAVDPLGPAQPPSSVSVANRARFVPVKAALGIGTGETEFHRNEEWWGSITPETITGTKKPRYAPTVAIEAVPSVDAVDLLRDHDATALVLDIEGSEYLILWYVARKLDKLPKLRTIVAELHPWHVDKDGAWIVEDTVLAAGFETKRCFRNPLNGYWHIHWERPT